MTDRDICDRLRSVEIELKAHESGCAARWAANDGRLDRISRKQDRLLWAFVGLLTPLSGAIVYLAMRLP